MQESYLLIISDGVPEETDYSDLVFNEPAFLLDNNTQLYLHDVNNKILQDLVYTIKRQPQNLLAHLQRIILCYEVNNEAQLSAALMDLFIILKGMGDAIKQRMLAESRKHLSAPVFKQLQIDLNTPLFIQGNIYTVLSSGQEVDHDLLLVQQYEPESNKKHDPLQIARDYIEYCQLDEAIKVLESAILETPQRSELHADLIELYQSTNDRDAFNKMQLALAKINHPMQVQWDALNSYFNQ